MRVRALSPKGDYQFGYSATEFLVDSSAAVAQCILTRLRLMQGEWPLDSTEGTPYLTEIIGRNGQTSADLAVQEVILGTFGVVTISDFSSSIDPLTRSYSMTATVVTQYGTVVVTN